MRLSIRILAVIALCAFATPAAADAPTLMNHQGLLTNTGGTPQVGTFTITFKIYDVPSGVNPALWTETRSITTDVNGKYNVLLGEITPLGTTIFSGPDRYLGVAVSPDPEMTPRTRLATVPYSNRVSTVDGASGGAITTKVSIGPGHTNSGTQSFVTGQSNIVTGSYSSVGGGLLNQVDSDSSTCAGGRSNLVQGAASAVGGGTHHQVTGAFATIAGGQTNAALADWSSIGGGNLNEASGSLSTVCGGYRNTVTGDFGAILGGQLNNVTAPYGTALGVNATADDQFSFIWSDGTAAGTDATQTFKVVATNGSVMRANSGSPASSGINDGAGYGVEAYSFNGQALWAHTDVSGATAARFSNNGSGTGNVTVTVNNSNSTGIGLSVSTTSSDAAQLLYNGNPLGASLKCFDAGFNNAMLVTAGGRVAIGNVSPLHPLHLASGAHCTAGGIWTNASDRALKEHFKSIDREEILDRLANLPIQKWNYRNEGTEVTHIGATAQDFMAAFGLGDDDKSIGTLDADGVAMVAIQALNDKVKEIDELKSELADLQRQVRELARSQGNH